MTARCGAMGYSSTQLDDLAQTIRGTHCDLVLSGTPIRLARLLEDVSTEERPVVDVRYELEERTEGALEAALAQL